MILLAQDLRAQTHGRTCERAFGGIIVLNQVTRSLTLCVKIELSFHEEQFFVVESGVLKAMLIDCGYFRDEFALIKIKPLSVLLTQFSILFV